MTSFVIPRSSRYDQKFFFEEKELEELEGSIRNLNSDAEISWIIEQSGEEHNFSAFSDLKVSARESIPDELKLELRFDEYASVRFRTQTRGWSIYEHGRNEKTQKVIKVLHHWLDNTDKKPIADFGRVLRIGSPVVWILSSLFVGMMFNILPEFLNKDTHKEQVKKAAIALLEKGISNSNQNQAIEVLLAMEVNYFSPMLQKNIEKYLIEEKIASGKNADNKPTSNIWFKIFIVVELVCGLWILWTINFTELKSLIVVGKEAKSRYEIYLKKWRHMRIVGTFAVLTLLVSFLVNKASS